MFHLRELITVLCLVLLAWTLLAPSGAPDLLYVLPVIGTLLVAAVSIGVPRTSELNFRRLDPSLFSLSLRAPPQL